MNRDYDTAVFHVVTIADVCHFVNSSCRVGFFFTDLMFIEEHVEDDEEPPSLLSSFVFYGKHCACLSFTLCQIAVLH